MCRLLALASVRGISPVEWFDALAEGSRRDYLAEEYYGFKSHDEGWGYALALINSDLRLLHYRTSVPMWEDRARLLPSELAQSPFALIAHTRKSSKGMPRGGLAAHPYSVSLGNGGVVYVAQNGGIDREASASLLKRCVDVGRVVDSYIYALLLAERLEEMSMVDALENLQYELAELGALRRITNTIALYVEPSDAGSRVELGVVRSITSLREEVIRYGELYAHFDDRGIVVASSTIAGVALKQGLSPKLSPLARNLVLTASLLSRGVEVSWRELEY